MATIITDRRLLKNALAVQQKEINEYHIYTRLARFCEDPHNSELLFSIAGAERKHALFWEQRTGIELKPQKFNVFKTVFLTRILGLTFTLKRMEKNEGTASKNYQALTRDFPEVHAISGEEAEHERQLLNMLDEKILVYAGSIVLRLNDALVSLAGAMAGFTLALGENRLIVAAGLVTGISTAFSMGASVYLSGKEANDPGAAASALYTGGAYSLSAFLLMLPFLILSSTFLALAATLGLAVLIILGFNYYLAIARDMAFKRRSAGMALIILGAAALACGAGFLLRKILGMGI
jgi:VIT1/CCC1 family predicted Fe2+/Mn2+ transporter